MTMHSAPKPPYTVAASTMHPLLLLTGSFTQFHFAGDSMFIFFSWFCFTFLYCCCTAHGPSPIVSWSCTLHTILFVSRQYHHPLTQVNNIAIITIECVILQGFHSHFERARNRIKKTNENSKVRNWTRKEIMIGIWQNWNKNQPYRDKLKQRLNECRKNGNRWNGIVWITLCVCTYRVGQEVGNRFPQHKIAK